jgi:hypothetical protein
MQVSVFGFNWSEVCKRPDAEAILDEMIRTDDVDLYATYLPDAMWPNDSASLHFSIVDALNSLSVSAISQPPNCLDAVKDLLAGGDAAIDQLGLSPLTDHCYFMSLSPESVSDFHQRMQQIDLAGIAAICTSASHESPEDVAEWLRQWKNAIDFVHENGLGLIAHCG